MTLLKSELVAAVRDRLSDPSRWIKHALARDKNGISVESTAPTAVSWCIEGAMRYELHQRGVLGSPMAPMELYQDLSQEFQEQYPEYFRAESLPLIGFQCFNDDHRMTHADMLKVLEKTYAKLVERGE